MHRHLVGSGRRPFSVLDFIPLAIAAASHDLLLQSRD
jgi:hypothetical protein